MKIVFKILPYALTTIIVIVVWKIFTLTDNYAWNPKGREILALGIALNSIFITKVIFWIITTNIFVFSIQNLLNKNVKIGLTFLLIGLLTYFFGEKWTDKNVALNYYTVFLNQSVSEEYIEEPILDADYEIGKYLAEDISDKQMKYRRYAIAGIGKIKYDKANEVLEKILFDPSENENIKNDVLEALEKIGNDDAKRIITNFRFETNNFNYRK
ncbi:HEAT repeat domain-containing protein [Riemerella anatipestifer]|nr:HEAT repeat domain-containing protein [Riemerella anatipestifer]